MTPSAGPIPQASRWALCTEFVHDLRRAPTDERLLELRALPRPAIAVDRVKLPGQS